MGSPFRLPYSFAIGYENQFAWHQGYSTAGTAGLIKQGVVAADVTVGTLFYTANTVATTIVALTCNTYSSNTGYQEGRIIRIVMIDNSTQFAQSGNIVLSGSGNFGLTANSELELMQSRGSWYEISRTPQQTQDYQSKNLGTTTNNYISADKLSAAFLLGTAATATLQSISGGYIGQVISVVLKNVEGTTYTVNSSGNITFSNTAGVLRFNTGGALQAIKVAETASAAWYVFNPVTLHP